MIKKSYNIIFILLVCYSCHNNSSAFYVPNNKVCFDTIMQGERIDVSFNLINNTKDTVRIENSSKSCECISVIKNCEVIYPNSCDSIIVSFQSNEVGDIVRGMTIMDSYNNIPIELLVYGYVKLK